MENVKIIQEELKKQKKLIEDLEGTVYVAKNNPTPMEITSGIASIPKMDLSDATATEEDVKQGKTFYAGSPYLKVGSAIIEEDMKDAIFMAPAETQTYEGDIFYSLPSSTISLKQYTFYKNYNHIRITFNEEIETIEQYAFNMARNFRFENFDTLKNLKQIDARAFASLTGYGISLENMPDSITNIGSYAFYDSLIENTKIKLPQNITYLGYYTFMSSSRKLMSELELPNVKIKTLSQYCFQNVAFNCDLNIPSSVTRVDSYFNYGGSFKNITVPAKTILSDYCFNASSYAANDLFFLKTVVFESESPLAHGTLPFATQHVANGLKIFVPDTGLEAYKALAKFASYADIIYPMSQSE